jgi:hypothetical protein
MTSNVAAPPVFDAVTAFGIGGLAVGMAVVVLAVWRRYVPTTATAATIGLALWMALTGTLAGAGMLAQVDRRPPPMVVLIPSVVGLALAVGLSGIGRTLAGAVPLATLVGLQVFRLPLELVMHRAGELGIMPRELSYGGYNFDILTGAGALVLWLLMRIRVAVPRVAIWAWNVWGLWCLAVIWGIAVGTSPMVRAFGDDPRHVNTWVLYLPYVWLPAVLVVLALAGHIVITRALLATRSSA